jgi:hypothetical protein
MTPLYQISPVPFPAASLLQALATVVFGNQTIDLCFHRALDTPGHSALLTFPNIYPDLSASSDHVFVSKLMKIYYAPFDAVNLFSSPSIRMYRESLLLPYAYDLGGWNKIC